MVDRSTLEAIERMGQVDLFESDDNGISITLDPASKRIQMPRSQPEGAV